MIDLQNFLAPFDNILSLMGATLTPQEVRKISNGGIDITPKDMHVLPDRTLAYKNHRIVAYIRDWSYSAGTQPKFHIAQCKTLVEMTEVRRGERYIGSNRKSGSFNVNWINAPQPQNHLIQLNVCKNCLKELNYKGYNERCANTKKIHDEFSLEEYFNRYPIAYLQKSDFQPENARINQYNAGFDIISHRLREQHQWSCQHCGVILSGSNLRKYLHVHHKNGLRNDDRESNLQVLCLKCHSEQPNHQHLREKSEWQGFIAIYSSLPKNASNQTLQQQTAQS